MKKLILFLVILITGCQGKMKSFSSQAEGGFSCKAKVQSPMQSQQFISAYEKENRKVIFTNTRVQSLLPQFFPLSVLVDQQCILKSKKLSALTKDLKKSILPRDFSKFSVRDTYSVALPFEMSQEALSKIADSDKCIIGITQETYAQPTSVTPNDTLFSLQSHMKSIEYDKVYEKVFATPATKLTGHYIAAVIDTGYVMNHEDLQHEWWVNQAEANGQAHVDDDNNGIIDDIIGVNFAGTTPVGNLGDTPYNEHGTHVSGFIGAETNNNLGVAGIMGPNVKIIPLALWPTSIPFGSGINEYTGGPMSKVAQAIRYAVDMGAQVINISMKGDDPSPNIEAALHYAVEHGTIVVVSAANDAKEVGANNYMPVPISYAKDIDGVIGVAATNSENGLLGRLCDFSNYSTTYVEMAAPGCDMSIMTGYEGHGILSCLPGSVDPNYRYYGYIQGTSMSSPVAAGVALYTYALLKEFAHQTVTPALVENVMKAGSLVNPNLVGKTVGGKQVGMDSIYNYIDQTYVHPPGNDDPPGDDNPPTCP